MTTLPGETGAGGTPASSTGDGGPAAVHVRGLVKAYSGVRAVNGIDLDIRRGEIFALLGPNGAGKTTTVEILEGYRTRDGGEVAVLGYDPGRQRAPLKRRIGIVLTAAFGRVFYSADIPTGLTLLRFLVMLVVGAAAFCALGLATTAVIPNADASAAIVNAIILPLLFLSGIFIPFGNNTPNWILWIARIFPVKHFADGMQAGFLGTAFHWTDVLVVAAWGLAGLALAMRFFSWEPRRS